MPAQFTQWERMGTGRELASLATLTILLSGCGPSGPAEVASGAAPRLDGPRRITIAFPREMDLAYHLGMGRAFPRTLVNPGLSVVDDRDVRRPTLAEAVPTPDNGLWKVFPDGWMETTWTIREGARWHDGAPFTTHDLVFTATVGRDREVAIPARSDDVGATLRARYAVYAYRARRGASPRATDEAGPIQF